MTNLGGVGWVGTSVTYFRGETLLEAAQKMIDWLVYKQGQGYAVENVAKLYDDGVLYVEYILIDKFKVYV